ncbi:unnamed protein product [Rotaria socialis]|uniref:Uncharacterized protein n=1 Tax=Rotaria socialis TaxID=392032 RepID=A0A818B4A5_9BILA|nr:unnamed protein product [Rotaria socialis]CAF3400795.1 unnamed protein product [Rotaria socialis]CAF3412839.1 unnamed protein product [Rotaria socialis]CAF3601012.1 unnamed protein product [Rotaria socialis]CAF3687755.1 unnamed protein product [Rotaria socialis]
MATIICWRVQNKFRHCIHRWLVYIENKTCHPVCAAVERKIGIMYYENNVISSKRNVLKRKFTENNVVVELKPNVDEQDNAAGDE